jgi:putative endonuclease
MPPCVPHAVQHGAPAERCTADAGPRFLLIGIGSKPGPVSAAPLRAARHVWACYNKDMRFFVYILASWYKGTLYVGLANDLSRRLEGHRAGSAPGFTKTYKVHRLVYYEEHASLLEARQRERVLKRWRREWKFKLIESVNPTWRDLTPDLVAL